MKKYILDLKVRETVAVGRQFVLLRLTADEQLPEMLPGQFVEVRIDETPSVLLRRPISIHYYDQAANELGLLVQLVGNGTRWMATLEPGDTVNIVDGPLANFSGVVEEIDREKNMVRVTISMFGRETSVELELDQVELMD